MLSRPRRDIDGLYIGTLENGGIVRSILFVPEERYGNTLSVLETSYMMGNRTSLPPLKPPQPTRLLQQSKLFFSSSI